MPAYSRILLPWDSQPQEVVGVDWNNPLASGLLIAILPQLPVNLADGVALSAYGTRVVSGGARGMMNTSGGMLLPAPVNASDPSAKYDLSSGTALVVAVQSTETNDGVVFNRGRGSSAPLWAIGLHGGSFDGAYGSWGNSGHLGAASGGPVPTVPRAAVITANGSTATVYIDGVQVGSGSYTPGTPEYDTANLRRVLFGLNRIGANTNTNTFLALLWDRPLSVAEVKEVSANPWQLFAPRIIWVPVSAGGGVSGTLATTNANDTAAAAGTTTIVGTLAATNANDTSAASGTTTILGTVAATNTDDTCAASGTVGSSGTTGTVAYTNADDTAAATGTTTVTGTVARSNADDSVSASGWVGAITGTLNVTNANDTAQASGTAAGGVQTGGGGYLPSFRRKTRKEIHAERVRLGILPEQIRKAAKKVVEKAAEQGDPEEVYEDNTEKYKAMFLREVGATKWAPDYARAIRIQLELMERDAEDALLLML